MLTVNCTSSIQLTMMAAGLHPIGGNASSLFHSHSLTHYNLTLTHSCAQISLAHSHAWSLSLTHFRSHTLIFALTLTHLLSLTHSLTYSHSLTLNLLTHSHLLILTHSFSLSLSTYFHFDSLSFTHSHFHSLALTLMHDHTHLILLMITHCHSLISTLTHSL